MSEQHVPLDRHDSVIVLIDHQLGVLGMVNSLPREVLAANVGMLARLGEQTGLPLVISTTNEELDPFGATLDGIRDSAPAAYARRIARLGTLNAFEDSRFVEAVEATGRQTLIMAGLLTNVCLWATAASALEAGYHVRVIADASGSTSEPIR